MSLKTLAWFPFVAFCCMMLVRVEAQMNTPEQWERIRKARETEEADRRRQQEEQERNRNRGGETQGGTTAGYKPIWSDAEKYKNVQSVPDANGIRLVQGTWKYARGLWGMMDRSGELITGLEYDYISGPSGAIYYALRGKKYGFIGPDGRILIPFEYEQVLGNFEEGTAIVVQDGKRFKINGSGSVVGEKTDLPPEPTGPRVPTAEEIAEAAAKKEAERVKGLASDANAAAAKECQARQDYPKAVELYAAAGFPSESRGDERNLDPALCLILASPIKDRYRTDNSGPRSGIVTLRRYHDAGGTDPRYHQYSAIYYMRLAQEWKDLDYEFKDALEHLRQIPSETRPGLADSMRVAKLMGICHFGLKRYDSAITYLRKDRILHPEDWDAADLLWQSLVAAKDHAAAVAVGLSFIPLFPDQKAYCYNMIAWTYGRSGQPQHGIPYADSALASDGQSNQTKASFSETRAYLNFLTARYGAALADYNVYVQYDSSINRSYFTPENTPKPANAETYFFRGKTLAALGNRNAACQDWKIASRTELDESAPVSRMEIEDAVKSCIKRKKILGLF